jgi:hypothetical protein
MTRCVLSASACLSAQACQQSGYYMGQPAGGPALMAAQGYAPAMLPPRGLPMMGGVGLPAGAYGAPRPAYGASAPVQSVISGDGSTLRLRGLPYSAGVDEITEFFSGAAAHAQP